MLFPFSLTSVRSDQRPSVLWSDLIRTLPSLGRIDTFMIFYLHVLLQILENILSKILFLLKSKINCLIFPPTCKCSGHQQKPSPKDCYNSSAAHSHFICIFFLLVVCVTKENSMSTQYNPVLRPEQEMAQFQASVEAEGQGPCVFSFI